MDYDVKAITTLIKKIRIHNIYLASWQGTLKNTGWKAWQEIEKLQKMNIKLLFIGNITTEISLDKDKLIIKRGKNIKKNNFNLSRTDDSWKNQRIKILKLKIKGF